MPTIKIIKIERSMRTLRSCLGYSVQVVILLCFIFKASFASALTIGQPFPNFTLPSAYVGYGQQLQEQHGKPVMLIVLDRCDRCQKKLVEFQHQKTVYALDDLETWIIWTSYKDDLPPELPLPVLKADSRLQQGWQVPKKRPALFLINRDGILDHAQYGSLRKLSRQVDSLLSEWMQQGQARPEGQ